MRMNQRGLVTALLCVAFTMLFGCAKEEPLYTAGLTAQTETESAGKADSAAAEDAAGGTSVEGTTDGTGLSGTLAGLDTGTESLPDTAEMQTEAAAGYVYVCGAVKEPGVYPITADMRVCDAVKLAGGFSPEADEEWLNQAAAVSDGQKLYIYTTEETDLMRASGMSAEGLSGTSDAAASGSAGSASADGTDSTAAAGAGTGTSGTEDSGKVNLNTAARDELMTLPGIGESKADAILSYREEHGAFASIEEIQNISGIKSGVFSQIKDFITV